MQSDAATEKAEADGSGRSRSSVFTRWAARFRLALSRTRPYILAAGAIYVGAFLVTFILRGGLILPEDRWLLGQPIVQQPLDLDVGFAEWVYVFRHNVVARLLGIALAGLPNILMNAYALGGSAASAHAADSAGFFWSLILPHGLVEIATSCVAWGVGLRFGRSVLARMRHRVDRRGGVRATLVDGFVLMLGLVVPATAVAALIEVELTTMWMPLPLAVLFGIFAGATFVALILGIPGPELSTIAAGRGSTGDEQDPAPAEMGASGSEIPEEAMARARTMLREIAGGGPAFDFVWKQAGRDARAACFRTVRRGQPAPDPIAASVAVGFVRRSARNNGALRIALLMCVWLFVAVALTDVGWVDVIVPGILAAALTLRTSARIRRAERVNRELVDHAVRSELAISPPATSGGFEAAFRAAIAAGIHPRGMSANVLPQRYPLGVALYGRQLAVGLVLVAVAIGVVWMFVAKNAPPASVVGTVGALFGAVGACVVAGASLFHQARPSPRPPVGDALVWRPTPAVSAGAVLTAIALGTAGMAVGAMGLTSPGFLSAGTGPLLLWSVATFGPLLLWFVGWRIPGARLEADSWGIRCTSPFTTVRIPWSDVRSLEARGNSPLSPRIVVVTEQGHERGLTVWDPRVPITHEIAQVLIAELEAVRRCATTHHQQGMDERLADLPLPDGV